MTRALEICVENVASIAAAQSGGADRIEVCSALALGGLTPSAGLIAAAARQPLPCHVMIRPRRGDFVYDADEVKQMERDIAHAATAGMAGVVFGATRGGALDCAVLDRLMAAVRSVGRPLSTTLHRAIDTLADPVAAIDAAVDLGFDRVLSSGGAATAIAGVEVLRAMHERAAGRLVVMAGSGVNAGNVAALLATGVDEIHASCLVPRASDDATLDRLGFAAAVPITDASRVRALREAIDTAR
ncbi:copper homeostasis protein CutC [Sphingomonas koreensis]|nr:copper homeostasis protein CutC [Sphingomonas koreensis]